MKDNFEAWKGLNIDRALGDKISQQKTDKFNDVNAFYSSLGHFH